MCTYFGIWFNILYLSDGIDTCIGIYYLYKVPWDWFTDNSEISIFFLDFLLRKPALIIWHSPEQKVVALTQLVLI